MKARDDSFCQQIAGNHSSRKRDTISWLLRVVKDGEFPANFLHHIILCLVLNYLQDPEECELVLEAPVIQKICKLWKTGIGWSGHVGDVLVELVEKRALVVVVSCLEGRRAEMMRLVSRLVHDILMIKGETCGNISVRESLVPKDLIHSYLPTLIVIESLESYSIGEISDSINKCGGQVVNSKMQSRPLTGLVTSDPFCMLSSWQPGPLNILSTVLNNLDIQISTSHMEELAISFSELIDLALLRRILQVCKRVSWTKLSEERQFQEVLGTWIQQRGKRATYRKLFEELSLYSIFCGRNPLVSSSIKNCLLISILLYVFALPDIGVGMSSIREQGRLGSEHKFYFQSVFVYFI